VVKPEDTGVLRRGEDAFGSQFEIRVRPGHLPGETVVERWEIWGIIWQLDSSFVLTLPDVDALHAWAHKEGTRG